jgi:hypothetical protein
VNTEPDPKRENGAYKWFIEELSHLARPQYAAQLSKRGHLERANEADAPLHREEEMRKAFVLKLSATERTVLGDMLDEARLAAVHDVAAFLEGRVSGENKLKISFAGSDIPASPYESMHFDLISILEGDIWPDE